MEDILNKFLDKLEKSIIDKRLEERRKMTPEEQIKDSFNQGNEFINELDIKTNYYTEIKTTLDILSMDFKSLRGAKNKYIKEYLNESIKLLQRLESKIKECEK